MTRQIDMRPVTGPWLTTLALTAIVLMIQGCAAPGATAPRAGASATAATAPVKTAPPPAIERRDAAATSVEPAVSPAQQSLTAGIDAYNRGDYKTAIKRLTAPEMAGADKSAQLAAHKYAAFSYCVTKRQKQCRQQFANAFRLDPTFDLAAGEKGHPLWAPAFEFAKRNSKRKK